MAPSQVTCTCCNKLHNAISMVKCCICKKLLKNSCVDISSSEVRLLSANKGCDWSCPSCRTFGNDLKDLKAIILKLQDDIKTLKDNRNDVPINDDDFLETIISEVSERAKRKKNFTILGVDGQGPDEDKNAQICLNVYNELLSSMQDSSKGSVLKKASQLTNVPYKTLYKIIRNGVKTRKKRSNCDYKSCLDIVKKCSSRTNVK
nr:unnamed protein product [Callosobruchus chinensis]